MPPTDPLADHIDRLASEGYTIVADALPPSACDALVADLERLERELSIQPAGNRFEGRNTLRIYNLLVHGEIYQPIPTHPMVLPIVEQVLDPGCLISSLSSITILPGEKPQPIHADDMLLPLPKPHPALICNTMWALTDFTTENGATRVVAGSHRFDRSPGYREECEAPPALMRRGSVLVYHGSLWHGGGENRSDQRRVGIAMNYCAGYLRQQENQQLGIPRELARGFAPRLQELVGYSLYGGVIGHVNRTHPAALLEDDFDPRRAGKLFDPS
jgi:ectoine hydroxylase-related dioxygenase (phytanoyl-CoA dioxygenase family)